MRIKELEAENILSIGHISIAFGDSGLVLLDGWNHDDNSHNGAGKTSVFNAIAFAVYNKLPRKVTASEIIRKGCKTGFARVVVQSGKDEYDIKRSRPTNLEVTKNGTVCPDMTQEQLEIILGLTYDQFLICMYSAQTESVKLLSLNDGSKKDFFLRLLSLEDFVERRKLVEAAIKIKSISRATLLVNYAKIDSKISAYKESVVDIKSAEAIVLALDCSNYKQEILQLSAIQKPDMSKFDALESNLNVKLRAIGDLEVDIRNNRTKLKNIDNTIANIDLNGVECPHCKESFTVGSKGAVTIEHLQQERIDCVTAINSLSTAVLEKATVLENISKLKIKRTEALSKHTNATFKIANLRSSINMCQSSIDLLNEKLKEQSNIANKIEIAEDLLATTQLSISSLNDEILVYEAVSSALSPTGAPAYVVDSVIDQFNDKVSQYVSLVWPNASYALQSYKENKSGDIKAKFSDKLAIQGEERSIGSLSGGELRCLSLAVDFAVIDVVETTFGISMNPIILDEGFEGLDSLNRERIIDVLETIASNRQIWVIDHATEVKSMFSRVVKIEKKDGVSTINEDL